MPKTNCIFCRIVAGEISAHKVYEDKDFLAFLDIEPRAPGHTQIIPKNHYRWVWDLPTSKRTSPNIGEYFKVAQEIAQAQKKAFGTDMILAHVEGEEVEHAHIWVYPGDGASGLAKDFPTNRDKLRRFLT